MEIHIDQVARDRASEAIKRLDVSDARDAEKWKSAETAISTLNSTVTKLGDSYNNTLRAALVTIVLLLLGALGSLISFVFLHNK